MLTATLSAGLDMAGPECVTDPTKSGRTRARAQARPPNIAPPLAPETPRPNAVSATGAGRRLGPCSESGAPRGRRRRNGLDCARALRALGARTPPRGSRSPHRRAPVPPPRARKAPLLMRFGRAG